VSVRHPPDLGRRPDRRAAGASRPTCRTGQAGVQRSSDLGYDLSDQGEDPADLGKLPADLLEYVSDLRAATGGVTVSIRWTYASTCGHLQIADAADSKGLQKPDARDR
jgi:hypothetical protein